MKLIDFKRLNLTIEEPLDLIKLLAQRRGVSTANGGKIPT